MQNNILFIDRYGSYKRLFIYMRIKTCMSDITKFRTMLPLGREEGSGIIEKCAGVFKLYVMLNYLIWALGT